MADSKMLEIAERLLERSEKGEVSWQDTVDDTEFIVALPEYSIVIERARPLLRMLAAFPHTGFRLLARGAPAWSHSNLTQLTMVTIG